MNIVEIVNFSAARVMGFRPRGPRTDEQMSRLARDLVEQFGPRANGFALAPDRGDGLTRIRDAHQYVIATAWLEIEGGEPFFYWEA